MRIEFLHVLLGFAVLSPLASFVVIWLFGPYMGKAGKGAGHVATMAILVSALLSFTSLALWLGYHTPDEHHVEHGDPHAVAAHEPESDAEHHDDAAAADSHAHDDTHADGHHDEPVEPYSGVLWDLGRFGNLRISISY